MKLLITLCALTWFVAVPTGAHAATKQGRGYVLVDTTSLPLPAAGKARLVVSRDMRIMQDLKPEFVFVDRTPIGILPQLSAVHTEVDPGWHRVWLGRGSDIEVWMEFTAGQGYLLRLRETMGAVGWQGDLVRESGAGYKEFALGKEMKLSVMDDRGRGALERDLGKPKKSDAKKDSIARQNAIAQATLPILIPEAWYVPLPSDLPASEYENDPGQLAIDDRSLRFTRGDSTVLEIPRADITEVYFGSQKAGRVNPWIKVGYRQNGEPREAGFCDAVLRTSTANYNRLFAEIAKGIAAPPAR